MDISIHTHALIPRRLIVDAANTSRSRALGRLRERVKDIRVTVTDRRLRSGTTCCQVEVDLTDGLSVIARSTNTDPVEVVSQAFDRAARSIAGGMRKRRVRRQSGTDLKTDSAAVNS